MELEDAGAAVEVPLPAGAADDEEGAALEVVEGLTGAGGVGGLLWGGLQPLGRGAAGFLPLQMGVYQEFHQVHLTVSAPSK